MTKVNWDELASLGHLRAVIDPADTAGFKNRLIDQIHWKLLLPKIKRTKRLMDFGCGAGRFAHRIATLGTVYKGIDTSNKMIEMAKLLSPELKENFLHYDGFTVPFRDETFDTCVSCWVYQYVIYSANNENTLSEIRRILTPGGKFILLEQASMTNRPSGSVEKASTEYDYLSKIAKYFVIESIRRVRMSGFSYLSLKALKIIRYQSALSRLLIRYLASWEIYRARTACGIEYLKTPYYDVLIEALKFK